MFCSRCGSKLPDNAKFCPVCGSGIAAGSAPQAAPVSHAPTAPAPAVKKKNTGKKVLFILLALILVIALAIAAVLTVSGIVTAQKKKIILGSIPDPEAFFNLSAIHEQTDWSHSIRFETDKITLEMAEAYMELLNSNAYPFVLIDEDVDTYASTGTVWRTYYFAYNGTGEMVDPNDYQIMLEHYTSDTYEPFTEITVINYTHFEIVPAGSAGSLNAGPAVNGDAPAEALPAQTMAPAVEAEPTPAITGPTLPALGAFLGGVTPSEDEPADVSGWHLYYRVQIDDGYAAAHEYLDLLTDPRYGFTLQNSFSDTTLYLLHEYYFFEYTGEEEITPAQDRYYLHDYENFTADVFVWVQRNGRDEYTGISIYYSEDLLVADLGDRATTLPDYTEGSDNSGPIGTDYYTPDFAKQPCLTCDGDGDCNKCGGYGTIERYNGNGEYIDSSCPDCYGNGKCRTCGGTGTRD